MPSGRSSSTTVSVNPAPTLSNDVPLGNDPEDSITALSWSPAANYLAVAAWDNKVCIHEVNQRLAGQGRALIDFDGPVLSCDWSKV